MQPRAFSPSSRDRLVRTALGALLVVASTGLAGPPQAALVEVATPRLVTENGGRVAWYHGAKHELVAYDAIGDDRTKNTELYLSNPDGSGRRCVTCDSPIPKGFVGQPDWHPDGEHIVLQVENGNSAHKFYNHQAWGIDDDLWIINRDGSGARKLWSTPKGYAALHPHFSEDGTTLMFAERVPTGKSIPALRTITPGGENHWTGWRIHLASVNMKADGANVLSNHRTLAPNGEGFYETHQITPDGRVVYSHTAGGRAYVDDVFISNSDGSGVKNLTNSPTSWDEHGQFSSRGYFSFVSSRFDPTLVFPMARPAQLRTELYVEKPDGRPVQLTDMNVRKGRRVAVSDYDWDRESRRIIFQVAVLDGSASPELWMIDVR